MGKKDNSKAKEKKAERKAMERRMNAGVATVKLANSVEDPLAQMPKPFSVYNKNGLDLTLETVRAPDLDEKTLVWAYDLVSTNMKPLYDDAYKNDPDADADFGWKEKEKKEEMREDLAWYLLARTKEGTPVAFSHFRYDMDYDDEVLYCYEMQVEKAFRRKGLGRFMIKVLEMLMIKSDMLKLMCTIFKKDKPEVEFFKKALKFEQDETSFVDTVHEQFEYEIICRHNLIKKKRMEDEEANEENVPHHANVGAAHVHGAQCAH
eukprot:GFUD01020074.1.p1 GENE.GFUD01020074.1~~GFUD01020074.1.p1  ORF type:complete len:263 (+),score=75.53 GFUD01020074.1:139-927(+)